jgi:hypothetical protein
MAVTAVTATAGVSSVSGDIVVSCVSGDIVVNCTMDREGVCETAPACSE